MISFLFSTPNPCLWVITTSSVSVSLYFLDSLLFASFSHTNYSETNSFIKSLPLKYLLWFRLT